MAEQFVAKVVEAVEPGQSLQQVVNRFINQPEITPQQEAHFKNLMENHKVSKTPQQAGVTGQEQYPSLIEQVEQLHNKVRMAEFAGQSPQQLKQNIQVFADKSIAQMDIGKNLLLNRDLAIKPSVAQVLQNKWTNVRNDLGNINKTLHLEFSEPVDKGSTLLKPLQKFFGYLIDGQTQMQQLKTDVNNINMESFSMADMLKIQLKMNHISQELEFFTGLLNKSLDSTKTLMNVQI